MRPIVTFTVANVFPEGFSRLAELCHNLYWTWEPSIASFFRSIDPLLWHQTNHHPLKMLEALPEGRLAELASDPVLVEAYRRAIEELDRYKSFPTWYAGIRPGGEDRIAYFSAEFGLHESVPLYSGGLGVLSGDHTKAASDLGLPFVGVGLMYQMGYFKQRLTLDGTQLENYDFNDPSLLPITEVAGDDGKPLRISVDMPEGTVHAGVWRLEVGRVSLLLLDTNIRENDGTKYRDIADYLYGGDQETRIQQEIILGIGGMRALKAMGISPTVTHSNEGHSAFMMLERSRMLMQDLGLTFAEASQLASAGAIFTTHTPVPAGHDVFPVAMMERFFANYWPTLGLSREEFYSLGRANPRDETEGFSMTILALKLSNRHNGVSQLHAHVSRDMWRELWPALPSTEAPIVGITNGVHTRTWIAESFSSLFSTHLGENWRENISSRENWEKVRTIPNEIMWQTKSRLRSELISYVRRRLEERQSEMYTRTATGRDYSLVLDPDVLTIGFARRFATYKRATLLFRDPERVIRLFKNSDRPVQMVFAGKAHPKDLPGKEFVKRIVEFIRSSGLEGRIVFLEDYDMAVARHMVQGCDVWLNTPRRPLEASGTSGMKAAINGTLNLSVLDGWFPEAYNGHNGFAIGDEREYADPEQQDEIESRQLYRLLEEQVVPTFYTVDATGVPDKWVEMQKEALVTMGAEFSADRMVQEYAERFYFPASSRYQRLRGDGARAARELITWKRRLLENWSGVQFVDVSTPPFTHKQVGSQVPIRAQLSLGALSPSEVIVEAFTGPVDFEGEISEGTATRLEPQESSNGTTTYGGDIVLAAPGRTGVTLRALPFHPDLLDKFEMNLVTWATGGKDEG